MKIFVKQRYKTEITEDVINKILVDLNLPLDYSIEYLRGDGRNIIIETTERSIFVIVSRQTADSRNAFLAQYIPTVLQQYIKYNTKKQKELFIYLLDTSERAKTAFIVDTYRVSKTLGIEILNESALHMSPILPYTTFADWKYAKTDRQQYNSANDSSYAMEDEDGYTIFGKVYGANGKESALMACLVAQIAKNEDKPLSFIQIKEHDTEELSQNDKLLLIYYGVSISGGAIVLQDRKKNNKSTCRKQDEFKFNLLEKYGKKKCYLCDCDIETNIIASHIHRIVDIDHSHLGEEEKRRQAVDADNGFWLCANHDKLFEYGVVTFDKFGKLVVNSNLKSNQIDFINEITNVSQIETKHFTKELLEYLIIHNKRVNLGI